MFLYKPPNLAKIDSYTYIMKHHEIDCIKLLKGGEKSDKTFGHYDDLNEIPKNSKWCFAIQPTIWKTQSYLRVCEGTPNQNIWQFEVNGQRTFKNLKMKALYAYKDEPKRGKHHWDSDTYPFIATAIGKGKWNFGEYEKELITILAEYGIDPAIRGTF